MAKIDVRGYFDTSFCNCYKITVDDEVALVDVGALSPELEADLIKMGDKVRYILLTHDHFDHILGIEKALKLLKNAKVAIHKDDVSGLTDSNFSLCSMVGLPQPNITPDILLSGGEKLALGGEEIKVIHTPGHTDGSVCFLIGNHLLSGDTLFEGSIGRTDFISGDYSKILSSLKKLSLLAPETNVYSGHGVSTTIKKELETNPYFNL